MAHLVLKLQDHHSTADPCFIAEGMSGQKMPLPIKAAKDLQGLSQQENPQHTARWIRGEESIYNASNYAEAAVLVKDSGHQSPSTLLPPNS